MASTSLPEENSLSDESIGDYILDDEIGRGHIGVVYKAHHKDISTIFQACKIIPRANLKSNWETELIKVGKLTGIPQVVQYKSHKQDNIKGVPYVCIFWDYVPGMDLGKYVKKNPSSITLLFIENLLKEVLVAFHAMKDVAITHDDLHAGNILVHSADTRYIDDQPRFKISDFGIGCSRNFLVPKDDYAQLASICHGLLEKIDTPNLNGEGQSLYDRLVKDFLPKRLLENNPVVGSFVRNPKELLSLLNSLHDESTKAHGLEPVVRLNQPFDFLSCEHIGNAFDLLQRLYSQSFPGYDELLLRNNTVLTGPRGCGKTTIFRNLSLKTRLLTKEPEPLVPNSFLGIYYYCQDLFAAFPYSKDKPSNKQRKNIVYYFNMALLCEIIDTLTLASRNPQLPIPESAINSLQDYLIKWTPDYLQPPKGTDVLRHMLAFYLTKKQRFRTELAKVTPSLHGQQFLPLDFIPNLCKLLQEQIPWMKDKPVFLFIDDYSLPRISSGIQETLNDLLFSRYHECIFKISTESVTTLFPYDSNNKLLDETRDYDLIDLGDYFLHAKDEVRRTFLQEVINNRLKISEGIDSTYHDVATILGDSYRSSNQLARELRQAKAGVATYYYGWDIVTQLCSGDIAHMLRLVRDVFIAAGGYAKFSTAGETSIPLDHKLQNRAIKELGNDFLNRVEAVPATGKDLRRIAEAFGAVAHHYLLTRISKNQENRPPLQAFRIEVKDAPYFDDKTLEQKYRDLLRCAVFLRDVRGKSQRGAVVPRLYLRRLLIPTFLLTPSGRDSILLEVDEFFLLLRDPTKFVQTMKKKNPQHDNQPRMM